MKENKHCNTLSFDLFLFLRIKHQFLHVIKLFNQTKRQVLNMNWFLSRSIIERKQTFQKINESNFRSIVTIEVYIKFTYKRNDVAIYLFFICLNNSNLFYLMYELWMTCLMMKVRKMGINTYLISAPLCFSQLMVNVTEFFSFPS